MCSIIIYMLCDTCELLEACACLMFSKGWPFESRPKTFSLGNIFTNPKTDWQWIRLPTWLKRPPSKLLFFLLQTWSLCRAWTNKRGSFGLFEIRWRAAESDQSCEKHWKTQQITSIKFCPFDTLSGRLIYLLAKHNNLKRILNFGKTETFPQSSSSVLWHNHKSNSHQY